MSSNQVKLSIVIISYNVKKKIVACCEPIINYPNKEIIIIDNCSEDGTSKTLSSRFAKKIKLVNNKKNLGFAKAVNQGIRLSKGDFILLLNPDTVPSKESIRKLYSFLNDNSQVGLVGGKMIHFRTKKINGTYVDLPNFWTGIFEFTNLKKVFKNNKFHEHFYYKKEVPTGPKLVYGLSGGFLMFKKELVKNVGYFDEHFFMYLEDVDFGIRVRNKGYKNYYLPDAMILHDSGSSSRNSAYRINVEAWRNSRNYFFRKYSNFLENLVLQSLFKIDDFIIDTKHSIFREPLK